VNRYLHTLSVYLLKHTRYANEKSNKDGRNVALDKGWLLLEW